MECLADTLMLISFIMQGVAFMNTQKLIILWVRALHNLVWGAGSSQLTRRAPQCSTGAQQWQCSCRRRCTNHNKVRTMVANSLPKPLTINMWHVQEVATCEPSEEIFFPLAIMSPARVHKWSLLVPDRSASILQTLADYPGTLPGAWGHNQARQPLLKCTLHAGDQHAWSLYELQRQSLQATGVPIPHEHKVKWAARYH